MFLFPNAQQTMWFNPESFIVAPQQKQLFIIPSNCTNPCPSSIRGKYNFGDLKKKN